MVSSSKDVEREFDRLSSNVVDTIRELEDTIDNLKQELIDKVREARDQGYDEGYSACEKDYKEKRKFVFR